MSLSKLYNRLHIFVLRNKLYHVLFWFFYLLIVAYLISPKYDYFSGIFPAFSILILHAFVSYLNIYFFIPNLLYQRRYLYYIFALLLSILLICFPLAIIISNFFLTNQFIAEDIWTPLFFAVNSIYILLTVLVTSFVHLFSDWYRKDRANKELEKVSAQNELKYLKSQINPHFLFNAFNSLYALTLTKSDKAPKLVENLSDVLGYLLYETNEPKVSLEKEIKYLKDLIEVEKIRSGDKANIELDVRGNIYGVEIEPLLFINFVENSFKHGVSTAFDNAWMKITIEIDEEKNRLLFEIENSKPVEKIQSKNDSHGGIGLINAKKRLKLLYPNKHKLSIIETNETYSVKLLLEIN